MIRLRPIHGAAALALGAALASVVRWRWQGTGNLWSKPALQPYVPDDILGWRRIDTGVVWLGLDLVAAIAAASVAIALAATWLDRRERAGKSSPRSVRLGLWATAAATWIVPAVAFASGAPPDGAREARPGDTVALPADGVNAGFAGLPAGDYVVVPHPQAAIAAELRAGGEAFEARFAGDLEGSWRADPSDLTQPMEARVSVAASSVDTGIALRSEHARADLQVEAHPRIVFELTAIGAAEQRDQDEIAFAATGRVELVGRMHEVDVTGTLRKLDAAARADLALDGDAPALLVQASLALDIASTVIGNDGTFDEDRIPIHVTLLLRPKSNSTTEKSQ